MKKYICIFILFLLFIPYVSYASPDSSQFSTSFTVQSSTFDGLVSSFKLTFDEWVFKMRSTSFFSLSDTASLSSISSGSSLMTINGGISFGPQQCDFSEWDSSIFTTLYSLVMIISSFSAFKIVTKGSTQ